MIGLASGLLAIAGVLAERAVATARSDRVTQELGIERHDRPALHPSWKLLWPPALLLCFVAAGPALAPGSRCGHRSAPVRPPPT
jgi:hypothetical protein